MIPRKLSELFFSQLWLLAIPIVLIPVIAVMVMSGESKYESRATIWVGPTLSGSLTTFGQSSSFRTPAENQAQTLNDLLTTRRFQLEVMQEANLISADGRLLVPLTALEIDARTQGSNLVHVMASASDPEIAAALVNAVLTNYEQRAVVEAQRQAEALSSYYQQQLPIAEAELATRQASLQAYLDLNPTAGVPGSPASQTLEYRTLTNNVEAQQELIEGIRGGILSTALTTAAIEQNQQVAFQLQDPPLVPVAPVAQSPTERLGIPLVGLMFGGLIAAGYLAIRYRTDHTIRSTEDLAGAPIPVLGAVSNLHPSRFWWRFDPARIYARRRVRDFARRMAATIPMVDER